MFKKTIILFLLIISGLMTAQSDSIFHSKAEIKFNLVSALLLVPNIGIEVQLSEKFGYQLDTSASFVDNLEGSPFHSTQIFNELRYYPKLKEGKNPRSFFIGPHVGYGMFTLRIPKFITSIVDTELKEEGSYQSGRNAYFGITIGKKIPLKNNKLNLEIFIGGGSSQSNYKYYNKEGNRIYENSDIEKDFNQSGEELIYKGGVMLTFKI
tara:strand:+ start:260 stop:886 length:627 start_codon:yes stop_codon:yes gene_type:complete